MYKIFHNRFDQIHYSIEFSGSSEYWPKYYTQAIPGSLSPSRRIERKKYVHQTIIHHTQDHLPPHQ